MQKNKLTIGLIYPCLDMYQVRYNFWKGISDSAVKHNVNIITYIGDELQKPNYPQKSNFIYNLVSSKKVDGLILWRSALSNQIGLSQCKSYFDKFKPLPIIDLEPIPNNKFESYSYTGTRVAVIHLIEKHKCKHIAFIPAVKGNTEAEYRLLAYKDILKEFNITYDPDLVASYDYWFEDTGVKAIKELVGKKKKFDGLVASNDLIAIGAINELHRMGFKIPDEIKVVGFDGIANGEFLNPPLTTIEAPFQSLGAIALEKILLELNKDNFTSKSKIPDKLIIRRSCGCYSEAFINAKINKQNFFALFKKKKNYFKDFQNLVKIGEESVFHISEKLFNILKKNIINNNENIFINSFENYLNIYLSSNSEVHKWNNVLNELRKDILFENFVFQNKEKIENFIHQGRVLIYETSTRYLLENANNEKQIYNNLLSVQQKLGTSFDIDEILNIVANEFPLLGILSCYISIFKNKNIYSDNACLIFAYNEKGRIPLEKEGRLFPSEKLVPEEIIDRGKLVNLIVMGLFFLDEQIGFIVYEVDINKPFFFDNLSTNLSISFKGAFLVKKIQEHTEILENGIKNLSFVIQEMTKNIEEIKNNIYKQATAVEEISSSIEEMSRNIEMITEISNKASNISNNLNSIANNGVNAVKKTVSSIQEVQNKSKDIFKLLNLIQNIVDQTKVLALNASIEAAHSDIHGAGFKIVATEIRHFSEETIKNISNISNAVKSFVFKIEDTSKFSSETILELEKIIINAKENSEISNQLFNSMQEEKKGSQDILEATHQLLQITTEIKSSIAEQTKKTEEFKIFLLKLRDSNL